MIALFELSIHGGVSLHGPASGGMEESVLIQLLWLLRQPEHFIAMIRDGEIYIEQSGTERPGRALSALDRTASLGE